MKKTYKSILAAIAAVAALASCNKDLDSGKVDAGPVDGGLHTIAVSFDVPTKTTLVGSRPRFNAGDTILISNGEEREVCIVEDDGKMFIRTKLEGPYKAVYPHTAALFDENNENDIIGVKVPAQQTGKFADANICMADQTKILKSETTASDMLFFENKVTILKFYVDKSIGVESIKVDGSDHEVIDIAYESKTVTVSCPEGCKQLYDAMPKDKQDPRICYVAIMTKNDEENGFPSSCLKFEVETFDGMETKNPTADAIYMTPNQMYNVFIPYKIKVQVGDGKYQYWGYCNVGAFLPEEPGLYFAWGDVKGHKADFSKDIEEDGETGLIPNAFSQDFKDFYFDPARYNSATISASECFVTCNAPYRNDNEAESRYSKYNSSDNIKVLQQKDDAASVNWGDKWRMPTMDEFTTLINGTSTQATDNVDNNLKIRNSDLLLPAAGMGTGPHLGLYAKNGEEKYHIGRYWTNNLYNNADADEGRMLNFYLDFRIDCPESCIRERGLSIRPIYDPDLTEENDPVSLTIASYPDRGKF